MKYSVKKLLPQTLYDSDEPKKDKFGNQYYTLIVTDEAGTEYKFNKAFRNMPQVGATLEGTLEQKTGDYGQYWSFTETKQPMGSRTNHKDTASIERQVALKCAVEYASSRPDLKSDQVLTLAEAFDKFLKKELEVKKPSPPTTSQDEAIDLAELGFGD